MIAAATKELGILARWYAEPLTHNEAEQLLSCSIKREQQRLKRHGSSLLSPYLKLIALHWLCEPTESHYQHLLSRREKSVHAEILKPLIYGQLLISRQQNGAFDNLDQAFAQARLLLRPEDYFAVLKRHRLLKQLPLGGGDNPGLTLEALLATAGVIERMKQGNKERPGFWHDPNDTYG